MRNIQINRVKKNMLDRGLTQMIVTDPISVYYICGKMIDPFERLLALYIRADGGDFLLASSLYAFDDDIGIDTVWYSDAVDATALLAGRTDKGAVLGIDKNMPARFLLRLMELGAATSYVNGSDCIDEVRGVKDAPEIARMKAASLLNDRAIDALRGFIRPGMTETELRDKLLHIYQELGADGVSFDPLIAFGPNAAVGHHSPDATALQHGDCVLLDIGCKKDGYCADMTRTYFCGEPTARMRAVYNTVKAAGDAAKSMIKPGVPLRDIDAAARQVIGEAGYGDYFTHRLGHFIGLEVHEKGDVSAASEACAEPGMIFSVEPGIYLPGEGGVRIEDLVLVTETGCETLNHIPRDLIVL